MPEEEIHTPKFDLLIDGSAASEAVLESIITIRVHNALGIADCLELQLANPDLSWTESKTFAEGVELSLKLGYEETSIEQAFKGKIVRRDCAFPLRGPAIATVVAFDKRTQLSRQRKSRTFLDMKDSEIINSVGGEAGFSVDVKATTVSQPYVVQFNQSNMEFILSRCRTVGFAPEVSADGSKLRAYPIEEGSAVRTLTWGVDLLAFDARLNASSQISEVEVRGWDMVTKEKISETFKASDISAQFGGQDLGAKVAESVGGSRVTQFTDTPIFSVAEAKAQAEARIGDAAQTYCTAEGTCQGDPLIRAGSVLEIASVGNRAGGKYLVNKVMHHFQPGLGYSTHFSLNRPTEGVPPNDPEPQEADIQPREAESADPPSYIEFDIKSVTGEEVEGWSYTLTMPNGEKKSGTLDSTGRIRVEGVRDPGEVEVEINPPEDLEALE